MAAANVPINTIPDEGIADLQAEETALDNTDGALVPNDGRTVILIRNAGAGTHVVTAVTAGTIAGNAIADLAVSVLAADWAVLPALPVDIFNNANGKVAITADGTKSEVKVVALRL